MGQVRGLRTLKAPHPHLTISLGVACLSPPPGIVDELQSLAGQAQLPGLSIQSECRCHHSEPPLPLTLLMTYVSGPQTARGGGHNTDPVLPNFGSVSQTDSSSNVVFTDIPCFLFGVLTSQLGTLGVTPPAMPPGLSSRASRRSKAVWTGTALPTLELSVWLFIKQTWPGFHRPRDPPNQGAAIGGTTWADISSLGSSSSRDQ